MEPGRQSRKVGGSGEESASRIKNELMGFSPLGAMWHRENEYQHSLSRNTGYISSGRGSEYPVEA
ncbi:hypothetical protein PT974_00154 [Cladobotryum mycophilum]|uniref:Uncharacterized protein n=1 Tax=Cladobotryum mycophilum TaxID=491253 RepID=A0ABR0T042_9HYPO